jgi:pimeloyl-ACP methyl ester carboxylesterase
MPRETLRLRVDDVDLACRVTGEGPPLLLIMGHTGTQDQWPLAFVNALARERRVITYDHRGMGESSSPPGEWSIERLAADAAGLLAALGTGPADVLGWSMGGLVAQELALGHPEAVRRLVLLATSAGGSEALLPDPEVLAVLHDDQVIGAERARRILGILMPAEWLQAHRAFLMEYPRPRHVASLADARRQWQAVAAWKGAWERLPGLRAPTLIVTGDQDAVTPPENSLHLAGRIPGAWLVRLAGGGHGVLYQVPQRLARIVRVFLEEVPPIPGTSSRPGWSGPRATGNCGPAAPSGPRPGTGSGSRTAGSPGTPGGRPPARRRGRWPGAAGTRRHRRSGGVTARPRALARRSRRRRCGSWRSSGPSAAWSCGACGRLRTGAP